MNSMIKLLAVLLLLTPQISSAATDDNLVKLLRLPFDQLKEVSIATKTKRSIDDIAAPVYVYTKQDFVKHGWRYLSELLRHIPGVDVQNAQSGTFYSVRGVADNSAHGNKTVFMIDGHNIGFPSTNSANFLGFQDDINLASVKRVEILTGPGGTLHGANAFGMVVDVITVDPDDIESAEASFNIGSNGEYIPTALASFKSGKWTTMLSGTYWKQDKSKLAEVKISTTPTIEFYENRRFEDNYRKNYAANGYLDYANQYRLGFNIMRNDSGLGTLFLSTDVGRRVFNKYMFYFDGKKKLTSHLTYNFRSQYLEVESDPSEISLNFAGSSNSSGKINTGAEVFNLDSFLVYSMNKKNTLLTGLFLERSRQRPASTSFFGINDEPIIPSPAPEENWDNYAVYGQWEWSPLPMLNTIVGLRYIKSIKQFDSITLPNIGLNYHFLKNMIINLNYQSGYRPPSAFEKGARAAFLVPNPNLGSETIDSYQANVIYVPAQDHRVKATYFYTDVENIIKRTTTGDTIPNSNTPLFTDKNIAAIHIRGLELGYQFKIRDIFKIDTTGTYTRSHNADDDARAAPIVPYKLNFSFEWQLKKAVFVTVDNYLRLKPTTSPSNRVYKGEDAPSWLLTNISVYVENLSNIRNLSANLVIRNFFNDSYGHVDRRGGTSNIPSYHPQELINAAVTIRYAL